MGMGIYFDEGEAISYIGMRMNIEVKQSWASISALQPVGLRLGKIIQAFYFLISGSIMG